MSPPIKELIPIRTPDVMPAAVKILLDLNIIRMREHSGSSVFELQEASYAFTLAQSVILRRAGFTVSSHVGELNDLHRKGLVAMRITGRTIQDVISRR